MQFLLKKGEFFNNKNVCDIMRMSHTNYKNIIKGLGGDPMRFLLMLAHTLNVLSMNLLQVQGLFFWFVNVTLSQTVQIWGDLPYSRRLTLWSSEKHNIFIKACIHIQKEFQGIQYHSTWRCHVVHCHRYMPTLLPGNHDLRHEKKKEFNTGRFAKYEFHPI